MITHSSLVAKAWKNATQECECFNLKIVCISTSLDDEWRSDESSLKTVILSVSVLFMNFGKKELSFHLSSFQTLLGPVGVGI